jgi:Rnl2 family RNA ligase
MFSEYEHMENYNNVIKFLKTDVVSGIQFIALEKIHGTNYSFLCDGTNVTPCKRSSSLGTDSSYYGHGEPFMRYKNDIISIFNYIKQITTLKSDLVSIKQIQLYCELFGGNFKGKTNKGYKCVQKNTNYLASNEIMAYDLKLTFDDNSYIYYDMSKLIELFGMLTLNLKLVPIVKIGFLHEIMALNPKFITNVPKIFNLEDIEDNFAEGYVVKPMNEMKFNNDECSRLIFKYKNPSFLEVIKDINPVKKTASIKQIYLDKLKVYVTKNRFNNLVTKYVDDWLNAVITQDIELMLIQKFSDDIKVDFIKDHELDEDFSIEYLNTTDKALNGFLTGFVKKIIHIR